MPDAYIPLGNADRMARLEQVIRRLDTDVQRLLMSQQKADPPISGGGGTGESGGGLARFQLTNKLYRGITSANANRLDTPGTETLKAEYSTGYWFGDETVYAALVDGEWQVVGSGAHAIGNNTNTSSAINKGASGTRSLANGKSVTVKANSGNIGASKKYDVAWDGYESVWVAVAAEC